MLNHEEFLRASVDRFVSKAEGITSFTCADVQMKHAQELNKNHQEVLKIQQTESFSKKPAGKETY